MTRRSNTLALASARGGSVLQIRGLLALEGLLIGLPAALIGYAAAGLIVGPLNRGRGAASLSC
ncbi:hypothetical protein [Ornithinimicrobium sp. INDO-MA30-4]|uniref:hypothetical protein n=1 Tax=Ornithinimicrobium sp. INDO-MA30-4 TaxID=2908651 RepID=UPI001F43AE55|nr:hypothetical protein [Ornithinimicrobium sp. INDO-MA30-4]UJH69685.1 hypothetical protein L0A91_10170 [Ornithinimicrobium sp. INDO-MA30-4]